MAAAATKAAWAAATAVASKSAAVDLERRRDGNMRLQQHVYAQNTNHAGLSPACAFRDASIIVQTDEQTLDMFCNWLHHYRQLKLPNPVYVVAYGSAAGKVGARNFENVSFVAPPRMDRLGGARGGAGGIGAQNFGSSAFYALNTAKIKVAAQLVRSTRRPVVFTDVDTALRRDPFSLLQDLFAALPPSKVFAIAPDQNERDPLRTGVCACFFAACANHAGERVLHRWWNASGGFASTVNEQKAFNRLVDKEPELLAGPVALLPYTHFPTGHGNPPLRPSVAMVHANWVRGHDAKVKRLRSHKLWRDGACADFQ